MHYVHIVPFITCVIVGVFERRAATCERLQRVSQERVWQDIEAEQGYHGVSHEYGTRTEERTGTDREGTYASPDGTLTDDECLLSSNLQSSTVGTVSLYSSIWSVMLYHASL